MLTSFYIDDAWVAAEYLRRCKAGTWTKENTVEAVKCRNLKHILDAEQCGQTMPEELTMDDLVNESTQAALNDHSFTVKQYLYVKTHYLSPTNLPRGPLLARGPRSHTTTKTQHGNILSTKN